MRLVNQAKKFSFSNSATKTKDHKNQAPALTRIVPQLNLYDNKGDSLLNTDVNNTKTVDDHTPPADNECPAYPPTKVQINDLFDIFSNGGQVSNEGSIDTNMSAGPVE